jgi:hypothetical protein
MNLRIRSVIQVSVAVCFFSIALPASLFSREQKDEEIRRQEQERQKREEQKPVEQAQAQQRATEVPEAFVNEARESAEKGVMESSRRNASLIDREFTDAVPAFQKAVEEYRDAVSAGEPIQKSLKDMDKLLVTFKTYFKEARMQGSPPDKTQFKDLSRTEIISETLRSAESLNTGFQQAVATIQAASRSNSVSVDAMVFLTNLHSDILRFELLRAKLK